jgi:hypothetical protein
LAGVLPEFISSGGRERKRFEAPPIQQSYIARMSAQRIDNALDTIVSRSNGTSNDDEVRSEFPIGVQISNGRMISALERFVAEACHAAKKRRADKDVDDDYRNEEVIKWKDRPKPSRHMLTQTQSVFSELDDPSSPALVPSKPFHHQPEVRIVPPSHEKTRSVASSAPMPSFVPSPSPLKYSKLPGEDEMADDMLIDDCVYPTLENNKVATIPLQTILELKEPESIDQEKRNDRGGDRNATKSAKPENQPYRSQQKHRIQNNREVTTTATNTDMKEKGNERPCSRCGNHGHYALGCLSQYGSHSGGGRGRGQVQHDSGRGGRGALRGGNQAIERVRRGSCGVHGLHRPQRR